MLGARRFPICHSRIELRSSSDPFGDLSRRRQMDHCRARPAHHGFQASVRRLDEIQQAAAGVQDRSR